MPPHCDSLDGPVVLAAARALETETVELILPFVSEDGESELRAAFELATKARAHGPDAAQVADRYFFETAVRIHRAGEGAPYTGLKPAGLDVGPVIPMAERAVQTSDPTELAEFLADAVRDETLARFDGMRAAKQAADVDGVAADRAYVQSMLGFEVWAHKLYGAVLAAAHQGAHHEHR